MSFYKIHDIHPYHAKFYPGIPQYFISKYASPDSKVLDPFCGSGTTLLECNAQGIVSVGIDINFLSSKISYTKINQYDESLILKYNEFILTHEDKSLINFPNYNYWFTKSNFEDLCKFYNAINLIDEHKYKVLYEVLLSSILNKVCNKRETWNLGYLSDNILPNKESKLSIRQEFIKKTKWLLSAVSEINGIKNLSTVICGNSKLFTCEEKFDLVITSPPYPFAVDFARNNRLSYYLFQENLDEASQNETGARYKRNKKDCERLFFEEIKDIYLNIMNCIKIDGYFCMTVADTKRKNKPIYFVAWLKDLFLENGWIIEEDAIRTLERQSMGQKRIPEEHLLVLKKIREA